MFSVFEIMEFEHLVEISLNEWQEYMWSAVSLLPNSPKILDLTNRDVFQLNVCSINGNLR